MAFTDEDKKELAVLIATAFDEERERRRARFAAQAKEENANKETKLYLITFRDRIAFPDDRGRAVIHDAFYARVTKKTEESHSWVFFGGAVQVVAFGDGKLLDKPFTVVLPGSMPLVEVEEGFLQEHG